MKQYLPHALLALLLVGLVVKSWMLSQDIDEGLERFALSCGVCNAAYEHLVQDKPLTSAEEEHLYEHVRLLVAWGDSESDTDASDAYLHAVNFEDYIDTDVPVAEACGQCRTDIRASGLKADDVEFVEGYGNRVHARGVLCEDNRLRGFAGSGNCEECIEVGLQGNIRTTSFYRDHREESGDVHVLGPLCDAPPKPAARVLLADYLNTEDPLENVCPTCRDDIYEVNRRPSYFLGDDGLIHAHIPGPFCGDQTSK